ncbi:peptidase inhibitor family I36 protein [Micromonosporaceae bacterium DT194]|uniref:peptidase inhibitor family I36 protein n=1 Tax=Melissospora conviva TaxID=3388432 RepID=UPI003C1FE32B
MRRLLGAAAATATAAALVLTVAGPASAATGYARCPQIRYCLFTGLNGTGVMAYFVKGDANLGDSIGPQGMNNNSKSHWNRSGHTFDLYEGAYKEGTHWVSHPHSTSGSNFVVAARDKISSLYDY